ncbi:MAG: DUF1566 domain-containing protein [Thermodesulfovibrionales bacterium]
MPLRYILFLLLCLIVLSFSFSSVALAYNLPDTGQTLCYNSVGGTITCPIPDSVNAQDGSYSLHPRSLTDNLNGTVTDNNTGLMWQKLDSGISQYNWDGAVAACIAATTASFVDWRLPTKQELLTIVDYSQPPLSTAGPSINAALFPGSQIDWYWTSTELATNNTYAWYINFDGGKDDSTPKTTVNPIRCVRGTALSGPLLFNHNNGTATDTGTGLMWMTGETIAGDWAYALSYCETLDLAGQTDWRLPDIKELDSLANAALSFSMPASVFPGVHNFYYWASTTNSKAPSNTWAIAASTGYINNNTLKSAATLYTRCVRGGQFGSGAVLTIDPTPIGGVVLTSPSGINCGTGVSTCSALYPVNAVVILSVTPDLGTAPNWPYFNGWTGDADCSDGSVNMDISKTCSTDMLICNGSMVYLPSDQTSPARDTIAQAYLDAQVTDTIRLIAVNILETIDFSLGKDIVLAGGSNCSLTAPAPYPYTFVTGKITISSGPVTPGSVTFENIIII